MSLILLFPNQPVTAFCWTTTGASTAWSLVDPDFMNLWGDWAAVTWGTIESSGLTWEGMAGYTFLVVTSSATTWTAVSLPKETC